MSNLVDFVHIYTGTSTLILLSNELGFESLGFCRNQIEVGKDSKGILLNPTE